MPEKKTYNYYPFGYKSKGWAPEEAPAWNLQYLARAYKMLDEKGTLNPVAKKYFLANALVERRWWDYGVNSIDDVVADTWRNWGGKVLEFRDPVDGKKMLMWEQVIDPDNPGDVSSRQASLIYGLMLNRKTGSYADETIGPYATETQRLALWNGVGKRAIRHALRVKSMHRMLKQPENTEIRRYFEGLVK